MTMPDELRVHPANLGAAAVELFASVSRERDWVHPSRRSVIDEDGYKIVEDLGHRPPTVEVGLVACPDLSVEESGMVARLGRDRRGKGVRLIEKEALGHRFRASGGASPHRSSS